MTVWLRAIAASCFVLLTCDAAKAGCTIQRVTTISPTYANAGTYAPPKLSTGQPVTITIGLTTEGNGPCPGSLTFTSTGLSAAMERIGGGGTLPYTLTSAGGASVLSPLSGYLRSLDFGVPAGATSASVTVNLLAQPAFPALVAGSYEDLLTVEVFNRNGSTLTPVRGGSFSFRVMGSVLASCTLPPPNVSSLDFTAAIVNGKPTPSVVQSIIFSNISCTAPARIRLSGNAMTRIRAVPTAVNLDDIIHWQARAEFDRTSVALDTRMATQATTTWRAVA
jgi:hypothetical protein